MPRKITVHGEERLRQRGITRADVENALNHPLRVTPGQLGSKWVHGYDTGGRILKVCISTNDENTVITAARPDSN